MKKYFIGFLLGMLVGTVISQAIAKTEYSSIDAQSIVGYGKYGSTILPISVDANGVVQLH